MEQIRKVFWGKGNLQERLFEIVNLGEKKNLLLDFDVLPVIKEQEPCIVFFII